MAKGTVNKVILLGRLGQDPDIRATQGGTTVANLNLATNELGPKDQNTGKHQEVTEWHRVTLFGKMADNAGNYLKKGSQVYIEGRLQTRKWQDQSGNDRYTTEIVANEMQFIGGGAQSGGQQSQQSAQQPTQQPQQNNQGFGGGQGAQQTQSQPQSGGNNFDDFGDFEPPF